MTDLPENPADDSDSHRWVFPALTLGLLAVGVALVTAAVMLALLR